MIKNIFSIILSTICLIGCVLQIIEVSNIYFSYQSIVNVRFDFNKFIDLPAITLSSRKQNLIDYEYLKRNFPNQSDYIKVFNSLNVHQQHLATFSAKSIIHKCMLFYYGKNTFKMWVPCDQVSRIKYHFTEQYKYYTIFSQYENDTDERFIKYFDNSNDGQHVFVKIFLNKNLLQSFNIIIHNRKYPPSEGQEKLIYTRDKSEEHLSITKTTISLLPSPYITACFDYRQIGYKSRQDCVHNCKHDYYRQHFGRLYEGSIIEASSDEYWNSTLIPRDHLKWMFNNCTQMCRLENCYNEYYSVEEIPIKATLSAKSETFILSLYAHINYDTTCTHLPKLQFTEFLIYVGSVFSLWFGISMISMSQIVINFLNEKRGMVNKIKFQINFFHFGHKPIQHLFERRKSIDSRKY